MSKLLVLTAKTTDKKKSFVDYLNKKFRDNNISADLGNINDIEVDIKTGTLGMKVGGADVRDYDLVFLRGINLDSIFTATLVAIVLTNLKIKFYDTLYATPGPHRTKLGSLAVMAGAGISIPETLFFSDRRYLDHFEELSTALGIPFVAKEMSLQRGKGVHLIRTRDDLAAVPEKSARGEDNEYFFQKHIDKDHEYRIMVLGDTVGVWEEKVKTDEKEFRNNVAVGAREVFFDPKDTPEKLKEVSIRAAKALGIQVAGVDVMTERKTGKIYLLEVNRGPGISYDPKETPELDAMTTFLGKSVKK